MNEHVPWNVSLFNTYYITLFVKEVMFHRKQVVNVSQETGTMFVDLGYAHKVNEALGLHLA